TILRAGVVLTLAACLAVSAESVRCQKHPLARLKFCEVLTHLGDIAGNIAAIDVRKFDAWQSLADEQVKIVQRTGLHPYQHLVFAGPGIGDVFILQNFRSAEFMETNSFHFCS